MNEQIVAQQLSEQLLKAAQIAEETVDEEIKKLESMDDDELERIRQKRVKDMKEKAKQIEVTSLCFS